MPHPDAEHGLQIQLATALRERDEAREEATRMGEACIAWGARVDELDAALAAANARADEERAMSQRYFDRLADAQAAEDDAKDALRESQEALVAARRECEGLTSSIVHLRLVGTQMATFIEEQMPLFGGASSEFDGEGEPREILKRWRKADKIADKSYALAAPGDSRDPAIEDADAAWRDGEAHREEGKP